MSLSLKLLTLNLKRVADNMPILFDELLNISKDGGCITKAGEAGGEDTIVNSCSVDDMWVQVNGFLHGKNLHGFTLHSSLFTLHSTLYNLNSSF